MSSTTDHIVSELADLDEAALDDAERALLERGELEETPEVAEVESLVHLATPHRFEPLSELERERAWRRAAARIGPRAEPSRSRTRVVGALAIVLVAAAVALVVLVPPRNGPASDPGLSGLGEEAHAALEALGVTPGNDTERARRLADDYRRRLEERG